MFYNIKSNLIKMSFSDSKNDHKTTCDSRGPDDFISNNSPFSESSNYVLRILKYRLFTILLKVLKIIRAQFIANYLLKVKNIIEEANNSINESVIASKTKKLNIHETDMLK